MEGKKLKGWGVTLYVFTARTLNLLDGKAVRNMIKTYKNKASIYITKHSISNTDLLRDSRKIIITLKALDHSNISTTQIYPYYRL